MFCASNLLSMLCFHSAMLRRGGHHYDIKCTKISLEMPS